MKILSKIKGWFGVQWAKVAESRFIENLADLGGDAEHWRKALELIVTAEAVFTSPKSGQSKDAWVRAGLNTAFDALQPYLVNALVGLAFGFLRRQGAV